MWLLDSQILLLLHAVGSCLLFPRLPLVLMRLLAAGFTHLSPRLYASQLKGMISGPGILFLFMEYLLMPLAFFSDLLSDLTTPANISLPGPLLFS